MKCAWLFVLFFLPPITSADNQFVEKQTLGFGNSYQDAVSNGLLTAVRQVRGLEIGSERNLKMEFNQITDKTGVSESNASINKTSDVYELSKGWVKSFDIVKVTEPKKGESIWKVKLNVTVPVFESQSQQDKRKRLAIMPFRIDSNEMKIQDSKASAFQISQRLSENITEQINHYQKFAIVNRRFSNELNSEQDILLSNKVSPEEASRTGQILGADIMLVGNIYEFKTDIETRDFYGAKNHRLTDRIDLHFSTIETTTGKIIGTNTKRYQYLRLKDDKTIQPAIISIATLIAKDVVNDIFPGAESTIKINAQEKKASSPKRELTPGSSEKPIKW